ERAAFDRATDKDLVLAWRRISPGERVVWRGSLADHANLIHELDFRYRPLTAGNCRREFDRLAFVIDSAIRGAAQVHVYAPVAGHVGRHFTNGPGIVCFLWLTLRDAGWHPLEKGRRTGEESDRPAGRVAHDRPIKLASNLQPMTVGVAEPRHAP